MGRALHYWISVVILVAALPLPDYLSRQRSVPLQRPLEQLDYRVGQWSGEDQPVSERVLGLLGTKDVLLRTYSGGDGPPVALYVSFFARQGQGEVSHSPRHCLPGAGWQPVRARRIPYPLPDRAEGTINEIVFAKDERQLLVYYWFRERERIVANEYWVKWYLMWDAMTRSRSDGALIRVSAQIDQSEDEARRRCMEFMREFLPRLDSILPG
jgi:EpsI family protein